MKKINFIISIFLVLIINSCNESRDIKYLSGYWEISSVSLSGKELKNYPFSGTIDYFILDEKNNGYRKKVKPRLDGNFDITMHEIQFKINMQKNDIYLVYGKGENFKEKLVKLDSMKLILRNTDGLIYKYKRFYPKNFLDE